MMIRYIFISVFLILSAHNSFSQSSISALRVDDNGRHANAYLTLTTAQQRISAEIPFAYTAIALKSTESLDFSEFAILVEEDTIPFYNEGHAPEGSEFNYSTLIHFDQPQEVLTLIYPKGVEGVYLVLINSTDNDADEKEDKPKYEAQNNCELPNIVQQSEWRSGLDDPNYQRSFTTTQNMIVHHSAYPNSITNYRQAVRDIYILHTQENGWSDIGYNYLVAPDGMLYAGRDPGDGEQDEVMGAHFCGSNGNVMGVCLLGNFEEQDATQAAYQTLEQLFAWKAFKDELNPTAQNPHPLNSNLGVIAGHRDGCNTACPGQYVYNNLPQLRVEVAAMVNECEGEEPEEPEEPVVELPVEPKDLVYLTVYPNPVKTNFELNLVMDEEDRESLKNLVIYDAIGKKIKWEGLNYQSNQITITLPKSLKAGMYFLYVVKGEVAFHRKFVIP
ncbi:N-acetylmuramoyl-L-alanine amidase [Marivirga sp. S37H4]|uniref:N-acetylmuramoyl-L-alanine amidase n=1 Tax=Marivirga aurantiaca TaxID=2802615 RepID=A0A934X039_9BACT|nr:N-acetylmuramoyl-L-alanine amidase [Marivirga aurantiaca]MBK6266017.1 N-acetylmuramoyl-L-alanine amidase [Marivirga aurantiaca]